MEDGSHPQLTVEYSAGTVENIFCRYSLSFAASRRHIQATLSIAWRAFMMGKALSHYKVLEKIGQGGRGEVFLAQNTTLKTQRHLVSPYHLSA